MACLNYAQAPLHNQTALKHHVLMFERRAMVPACCPVPASGPAHVHAVALVHRSQLRLGLHPDLQAVLLHPFFPPVLLHPGVLDGLRRPPKQRPPQSLTRTHAMVRVRVTLLLLLLLLCAHAHGLALAHVMAWLCLQRWQLLSELLGLALLL